MATDPKNKKGELTDEQAEKIAGGRTVPPPGSDGALDPRVIRNLDGQTSELSDGTRDADSA